MIYVLRKTRVLLLYNGAYRMAVNKVCNSAVASSVRIKRDKAAGAIGRMSN